MPRNIGPALKELLDGAHKKYTHGLRIETEYLGPLPTDDESFNYRATVTGVRLVKIGDDTIPAEEKFTGHGDASPNEKGAKPNTPAHDTPSRMAESRAIVRALRWATNVGEAAIEEMPYSDDEVSPREVRREQPPRQDNPPRKTGKDKEPSEPMVRYINNLIKFKLGGDEEAFEKEFGPVDELTFGKAQEAINDLKERDDV